MTAVFPITSLDAWIAGKTGTAGGRADREAISRYQLLRLNDTIKRVLNLSPFYRRHLAGAKPVCHSLGDITGYPLMNAGDVTNNALKMICGSQGQISRVVTLNTSGTTGEPKRIYFSQLDQELTIDFFQSGMSTLVRPGDKTLILLPGKRSGSVGDLLRTALLRSGTRPELYGLVEYLSDAVLTMCRQEAVCLVGVPVQILAMARFWEQWQGSCWAPRCALLSTDHVPAIVVSELRRIWNCQVFEHYGTEMGLGGGIECAAHDGYHLREDDLLFEIVDPVTGQALPDGEHGEVVFTTLTRQGMPLIRYRTGDISRFISEACPCGSSLRRLERIRYRQEGLVYFGGTKGLAMADLDEVLLAMPGVVNFTAQVIYGGIARLTVVLTVLGDTWQQLNEAAVLQALQQISAIGAALRSRRLIVEVQFAHYRQDNQALPAGKRTISCRGRGDINEVGK